MSATVSDSLDVGHQDGRHALSHGSRDGAAECDDED
jgi:hypothetical protein